MLNVLITAANPGQFESIDSHLSPWWWLLVLVLPAVGSVVIWVGAHRNPEAWKGNFEIAYFGVLVAGALSTIAIGFGYSVADIDAQDAPRAEWRAQVSEWLADDYGLSVTADEVLDMQRGENSRGPQAIIDGHIEYIELTDVIGGDLAVVNDVDELILPLASK
jgi:hypothetical protein